MSQRLEGQGAVVTGSGSGIGRATALRFAAEGARVLIADINEAAMDETRAMAGEAAPIEAIRSDVTREEDVAAMIGAAVARFGKLDILFNNAGGGPAPVALVDTSVADWDFVIAMFLRSVFLGIKHGARAMRETGGGSIINTASTAGLSGGSGPHSYSAAKAGVVNLTKNAAIELAPSSRR